MKEGRICERGTHEELVARAGEYCDFVGITSGRGGEGGATAERSPSGGEENRV
ncbi:UNVERIFIED_CONTAM: hypothetical protein GTU68_014481 [Idotea baltica]|nr:hypothetical protein [Idotea baltica]